MNSPRGESILTDPNVVPPSPLSQPPQPQDDSELQNLHRQLEQQLEQFGLNRQQQQQPDQQHQDGTIIDFENMGTVEPLPIFNEDGKLSDMSVSDLLDEFVSVDGGQSELDRAAADAEIRDNVLNSRKLVEDSQVEVDRIKAEAHARAGEIVAEAERKAAEIMNQTRRTNEESKRLAEQVKAEEESVRRNLAKLERFEERLMAFKVERKNFNASVLRYEQDRKALEVERQALLKAEESYREREKGFKVREMKFALAGNWSEKVPVENQLDNIMNQIKSSYAALKDERLKFVKQMKESQQFKEDAIRSNEETKILKGEIEKLYTLLRNCNVNEIETLIKNSIIRAKSIQADFAKQNLTTRETNLANARLALEKSSEDLQKKINSYRAMEAERDQLQNAIELLKAQHQVLLVTCATVSEQIEQQRSSARVYSIDQSAASVSEPKRADESGVFMGEDNEKMFVLVNQSDVKKNLSADASAIRRRLNDIKSRRYVSVAIFEIDQWRSLGRVSLREINRKMGEHLVKPHSNNCYVSVIDGQTAYFLSVGTISQYIDQICACMDRCGYVLNKNFKSFISGTIAPLPPNSDNNGPASGMGPQGWQDFYTGYSDGMRYQILNLRCERQETLELSAVLTYALRANVFGSVNVCIQSLAEHDYNRCGELLETLRKMHINGALQTVYSGTQNESEKLNVANLAPEKEPNLSFNPNTLETIMGSKIMRRMDPAQQTTCAELCFAIRAVNDKYAKGVSQMCRFQARPNNIVNVVSFGRNMQTVNMNMQLRDIDVETFRKVLENLCTGYNESALLLRNDNITNATFFMVSYKHVEDVVKVEHDALMAVYVADMEKVGKPKGLTLEDVRKKHGVRITKAKLVPNRQQLRESYERRMFQYQQDLALHQENSMNEMPILPPSFPDVGDVYTTVWVATNVGCEAWTNEIKAKAAPNSRQIVIEVEYGAQRSTLPFNLVVQSVFAAVHGGLNPGFMSGHRDLLRILKIEQVFTDPISDNVTYTITDSIVTRVHVFTDSGLNNMRAVVPSEYPETFTMMLARRKSQYMIEESIRLSKSGMGSGSGDKAIVIRAQDLPPDEYKDLLKEYEIRNRGNPDCPRHMYGPYEDYDEDIMRRKTTLSDYNLTAEDLRGIAGSSDIGDAGETISTVAKRKSAGQRKVPKFKGKNMEILARSVQQIGDENTADLIQELENFKDDNEQPVDVEPAVSQEIVKNEYIEVLVNVDEMPQRSRTCSRSSSSSSSSSESDSESEDESTPTPAPDPAPAKVKVSSPTRAPAVAEVTSSTPTRAQTPPESVAPTVAKVKGGPPKVKQSLPPRKRAYNKVVEDEEQPQPPPQPAKRARKSRNAKESERVNKRKR
ncbi:CUN067 hypothetical protein [Culex nigripalpus nucleopolyhedrovirus]|uniref:Uncharacterized protein n=1 Tax=Culex nigripalpus nucleopolyhedrovirus (isolate Florida/1997) TaxID=645993 RepID=Q919K9_NPVCO|nr:CUN067 hypothetical protein [Culex nigripalpus nucleopolyhedrovirus]AAK94145.1 CUN067 hypothetical protein [Culex nigripalpus nucleopolyhedrovirus]